MRIINKTPYICKICGSEQNIGGFRNHLQGKHSDYNTDKYVKEFGEFRPKKIAQFEVNANDSFECKECNELFSTHHKLMHHIKIHSISYEDYHIKHHFNGIRPLCKCGCGQPVKLFTGRNINSNNIIYARQYLSGHNTSAQVGVQTRTYESKMRMRESAIKRMERDGKRYSPKISIAQKEIYEYVSSLYSDFTQNDTNLLRGKEIDILSNSLKLGIEYNGLKFHSDIHRDKLYHINKLKEVENSGYRLIYIWEDWWVRKKDIVKSMLSSILNTTQYKLYARQCIIKEISDHDARLFLRETHIQGDCVSRIRLGLFFKDELVAVMTLGKLRKILGTTAKNNQWELLRFSSKLNTTIIGGASKLFSYFIRNYNPEYVISYANRDWSTGNMYLKLGFKFSNYTSVGYFYAKGKRRFSRSNFTKDKLIKMGYDKTKSESEIMKSLGYMKIWNCGNLKFEWFSN